MSSPLQIYHQRLEAGALQPDEHQLAAATALDDLHSTLVDQHKKRGFFSKKPDAPKGLYIHGGVGRGKSMLMDLFADSLPGNISVHRSHFHEFMIGVHDYMHERRSSGIDVDKAIPQLAKKIAKESDVLCFDEFHVTDIADAMILARLFTYIFVEGVVVVSTSNWEPERLYEGGLQRDRFLPFIYLLQDRMVVLHLDSATDYRGGFDLEGGRYLTPLSEITQKKMDVVFAKLTRGAAGHKDSLKVKGRDIEVKAAYQRVARFSFSQLCERPHGAEDYIEIAKHYDTVLIEGIPKLTYDRRNEAKRLMILIDALYEAGTRVFISAASTPDKLYTGHDHAFEFDRTISRLNEMQSDEYWKNGEAKTS
ncbi:MAG: AFG1 family ATPase [Micavibrio sp.]|nr:AFG1 family ATPase [Micavibrio sp.]